jgi:hypothetical protein
VCAASRCRAAPVTEAATRRSVVANNSITND